MTVAFFFTYKGLKYVVLVIFSPIDGSLILSNNQWKVVLGQQAPYISKFLFISVTHLSRRFLRIIKHSSIHRLQLGFVNCWHMLHVTYKDNVSINHFEHAKRRPLSWMDPGSHPYRARARARDTVEPITTTIPHTKYYLQSRSTYKYFNPQLRAVVSSSDKNIWGLGWNSLILLVMSDLDNVDVNILYSTTKYTCLRIFLAQGSPY